jgi:hypothetical protein
MTKSPLRIIAPTGTGLEPPLTLGQHGRDLWREIQGEYCVEDIGGRAMLEQCCLAMDRVVGLRAEIDRDGPVIRTRDGIKEHPLIKLELQLRSFIVRTLVKLGLNYEAIRSTAGRPVA